MSSEYSETRSPSNSLLGPADVANTPSSLSDFHFANGGLREDLEGDTRFRHIPRSEGAEVEAAEEEAEEHTEGDGDGRFR